MSPTEQRPSAGGAERRREKRYEVQLDGELGIDGAILPVRIGDISASGALLLLPQPPVQGALGDLWIVGFGDLEVQIVFSGDGIAGAMFTRPAECRDRLLKWLMEDAGKERSSP